MSTMKWMGIAGIALLATSLNADAAKLQNNYVYFALAGLQYFNFTETGHNITAKQPYEGALSGISKGQAFINVKAGRKKSTAVATWFKQQVAAGQTLVCDSKETYPKGAEFRRAGDAERHPRRRHRRDLRQRHCGAGTLWLRQ